MCRTVQYLTKGLGPHQHDKAFGRRMKTYQHLHQRHGRLAIHRYDELAICRRDLLLESMVWVIEGEALHPPASERSDSLRMDATLISRRGSRKKMLELFENSIEENADQNQTDQS